MKLYYLPGACSVVPHVALQWIGQPYEAEAATRESIKSPEYLRLNPQGSVPVLLDGDFVLSQNMAIINYLDQLYPQANLFGTQDAKGRVRALRWLSFCNADLHPAFAGAFAPESWAGSDQAIQAIVKQQAYAKILRLLAQANDQLGKQPFLGDALSIADVYLYVELRWCKVLGLDYSQYANLEPFYQRIGANTGVQAVLEQEGLKA